jgi:hypothetical protein
VAYAETALTDGLAPTMARRLHSVLIPAALVALMALSGCTGEKPADETSRLTTASSPGSGAQASGKATAGTTSAVLAEQTFDATARESGAKAPGGTVTMTLRSLEVSGKMMTLRWAFRWDNPAAADNATTSLFDLSVKNVPMLTDTTNLKRYAPLCTKGSWAGDNLSQIACEGSALVSPSMLFFEFTNHSTVEAWAVFAAPQDKNATFDVLPVDGWPNFSAVTPTESK